MSTGEGPPLVDDVEHAAECHERWIERSGYRDRAGAQPGQCMLCRYYIPLVGALADDWGVCSNTASAYDGQAMFEHDGCPEYSPADEMWQRPEEPPTDEERRAASEKSLRLWLEKRGLPLDLFGGEG